MNRMTQTVGVLVAFVFAVAACEAPETNGDGAQAQQAAAEVSEDGPSDIDHGGIEEVPDDPALVEEGEGLFQSQGCVACHQMDRASAGPALGDVTERRTAPWLARMIMHPEEMTDRDPAAKEVASEFAAPMTPTNLTPEQTEAIIAYLGAQ